MSRLEELIQELCPDGVKYIKLQDVCDVYDGTHQTPHYTDFGVKFVSVENISDLYGTTKYISENDFDKYKIKPKKNDVLMTRIGSIGVCAVVDQDEPLAYYVSLALLRPKQQFLNSRYLMYAIGCLHCRKEIRKRTLINAVPIKINMGDIGKITIPLPPLEVQSEIVRILDNFTELTAELTAELTSELTARKQQYEYYREKLLTVEPDVKWKKIGEIASFRRGAFPQPYGNKDWYNGEGAMPFVQVADIEENMQLVKDTKRKISKLAQPKSVFAPKGAIVISLQGSIGRIAVTQYDAYIDRTVALFQNISPELLPKYFAYQLQRVFSTKREKARGTTIKTITKEEFTDFQIPIPSLAIQERIIKMLDGIDSSCTDLKNGLLFEMEIRQKQYEYYRDKLLTFKEKIA